MLVLRALAGRMCSESMMMIGGRWGEGEAESGHHKGGEMLPSRVENSQSLPLVLLPVLVLVFMVVVVLL